MTELINIAGKVFPLVDQVSKNLSLWKTLKGNKKAIIRSLFFEVQSNIEILNTLNVKGVFTKDLASDNVKLLFDQLDISISEAILFGSNDEDKSSNFEYLKTSSVIDYRPESYQEEKSGKKGLENKTVIAKLYFVVKKVKTLQNLSNIDPSYLKNIRVKVRLDNVKNHLLSIEKTLRMQQDIVDLVDLTK